MPKLHALKSYYSAELGQMITLEDDVLGIVRQVRQAYDGRVEIQLDPETGWYHFVEMDGDTERLIFSSEHCDGRDLERLFQADGHSRGYVDSFAQVEREQDEMQKARDRELVEQVMEPAERLLKAMKQGGMNDRLPLSVPVRHTGRRRRA